MATTKTCSDRAISNRTGKPLAGTAAFLKNSSERGGIDNYINTLAQDRAEKIAEKLVQKMTPVIIETVRQQLEDRYFVQRDNDSTCIGYIN